MLPQVSAVRAGCDQYIDGLRTAELANTGRCSFEAAVENFHSSNAGVAGREAMQEILDPMQADCDDARGLDDPRLRGVHGRAPVSERFMVKLYCFDYETTSRARPEKGRA